MGQQKCSECEDKYPLWMIICIDETRICKICILSGQIKANKDRMDEIKMDIDLVNSKINTTNLYADDTNNTRKAVKLIEEKIDNIEKEELDFSGFKRPDLSKVDKEQKEERDGVRKSSDDVADEREDWERLTKDVGNMVASGIKEIRENICDRPEKEENEKNSLAQSAERKIVCEEKDSVIKNKFSLLKEGSGDEEGVDYSVLGNSTVKKFKKRTKRNMRNIYCSSDAGMEEIAEHLENGITEGSTVVIHGGGNDIKRMNTEKLMKLYKDTIEKVTSRGKRCIISGILPRLKESPYWSSRAIGINNRVQEICKAKQGVMYIDNWDRFYNNRGFYSDDGIHLNKQGSDMLSMLMDEKVQINSNLEIRRQRINVT